jgi:hypothetical protein
MAKMYSLNKDNRIVGQLRKIKHEINNHNHNKGLGEIFSVYGFLLLLTLPLLGTVYFASNESTIDVSNWSLINITTLISNDTNATNVTEILINGTIKSITLPIEENASEPSNVININGSEALLNITTPEPMTITEEPMPVIETMVEEIVYRHESITIGQRVQWYRQLKTHGGDNYTVGLNLPPDYSDLAMVDSLGNYTLDNGTLVLSGEHDIQMSFTTSPVTVSEQILSDSPYEKKVTVASNSTLHYSGVAVSVKIPEKAKLTIIEMPGKEIINDPEYNVTLLDTDGNGKADTLSWIVPQLSTKEYLIRESGQGNKATGIAFDRNLDCPRCGQHKVPSESMVNMSIAAAFNGTLNDVYFADYFPINWPVIDSNGGTVESYNSSHSMVYWHYDSITDVVSNWYLIRSEQVTHPTTDYDFISELDGQQSEPWHVVVADAAAVLTAVKIWNVTNLSRGSYRNLLCELVANGGNPATTMYAALQYQNGTGGTGGWINLSTSNAFNVSQLSTTPQSASISNPTNFSFNTLAMRTGRGNTFRCWGYDGTTAMNSSVATAPTMNISAPNLQLNLTNTSTANVFADDTNELNITVNVSTKLGNASSVHAYLQWNTSTNATWVNITTTATNALYADTATPILYTNVDNITAPDSQLYKISAHTAGTYWFRAYSNSSIYDGSFTNTTIGYPLTVAAPPVTSLLNVTIGNVSNTYRGDTENDIFCNATSTGGPVTANVSLQYLNGSNWINVNQSNWGGRISYDNTYGTNPSWSDTITTTGTIVRFAVFANWTGSAQFRCNVTRGAIANPTTWNISTNTGSMNVLAPPLNATIETDLSPPITIYNDDSNDLNLTCNVQTVIGNASSVSLYAQWNSTNNVWNNFSTSSGSLMANQSSPILFTNVDNSTNQTRVFRINGTTAGNYSVRCYANSSSNDGSNDSATNIIAVNVATPPSFRISNVTIGNVSNMTRGATETDLFCNVTLSGSGTGVTGFLSLQYYNITAWYDLNTTTAYLPKNLTYDNTYGGNPRNFSAITASTAYRFAVFGNWTGNNYLLRCNITDQTNLAYNISLNGTLNVTTVLLNSNATTDIAPPITLYNDQSNNFNLTCNVSAMAGNATSVTVFAQWNTSASTTWNNFSKSGSLQANDTNFTFFNVDTVTPDTLVYRINATASGSYWVRCFNNASRQDGSTTNNSNAIAVNVISAASLNNVSIGNVSNIYRGDKDDVLFCNATSSGGSVQANVTLQFQNATGWYTLNESFNGGKVAYVADYGTNPRWNFLVTTAGNSTRFSVFGNWTGNQVLRCNVTQGTLGSSIVNTSSTATLTIDAPLLNTSITTVPSGPITIYTDESNNFNLTCNVSTLVGNASNVTLYAQWNSTVDAWNNFSASGSLKANETSPINLINVDNATPDTRVFGVNSSVPGLYSVRCFANSSSQDGSNQNWTGIVTVNVSIPVSAISPADGTIVDRDSVSAGTPDYIMLNVSTNYTIANALNITFKANLTSPIGGQTNLVLGTNATNALGYAVLYWNPNDSFYAGNYTWWGEANVSYVVNRTKTVLVYGGFNLTFQSQTNSPDSSYVLGQNVTINATLRSFGPESVLQLNTSYLAKVNSTIIAEDSTTRLAYLNYSTASLGTWTGNYTLASGDPLSGNPYYVSLNASANYFFTNTTNFSRSFNVLTNITVSITLWNMLIDYGSQNPGTTVNASVNNGFPMIISVDSVTNVNTDVYLKSNETNMTGNIYHQEILVANVTFANNSAGTSNTTLNTSYKLLKGNIPVNFTDGTNVSTYWWMYVPQAVLSDTYQNHIIIMTNQSSG